MNRLPFLRQIPSPNYSSRNGARTRLCVIHDCEGSFEGSVSWFSQPRSQVSAHIVLSDDGTRAVQMVAWANKAWAVCNYNSYSESYEAAGYSAKGLGAPEWQSLAAITAFRLHVLGLSPIYARGGVGEGYCQHVDLGAAGGGHHDVTSDPSIWSSFQGMVEAAYALPQPDSWPADASTSPTPTDPPPAGFKPSGTVRHDLQPPSLEWCQMRLNALGFSRPLLTVDGMMGPATERAVAAFQTTKGLHVDGDPGPQTVAALAA